MQVKVSQTINFQVTPLMYFNCRASIHFKIVIVQMLKKMLLQLVVTACVLPSVYSLQFFVLLLHYDNLFILRRKLKLIFSYSIPTLELWIT